LNRYARTVLSVFDSARVLATPPATLIYWKTHSVAPCPGCTELARHSPYTPATLVTVPKSGSTPCLDNCKCTLEMHPVDPERAQAVQDKASKRHLLLKRLAKIKRTGTR